MSLSEFLNLVDENNKITGQETRNNCHALGLWHQRATVFVFNSQGELLLQKRAPGMLLENLWCGSASGHVLFGETYVEGARRELKEELGLECNLKLIGELKEESFFASDDFKWIEKEIHQLFVCFSDGPFKIQKQELSEIKFMPLDEIKVEARQNKNQFTPGFLLEFDYYLKNKPKIN